MGNMTGIDIALMVVAILFVGFFGLLAVMGAAFAIFVSVKDLIFIMKRKKANRTIGKMDRRGRVYGHYICQKGRLRGRSDRGES